ncbi:hypothetical protein ACJMK2_040976 [Sinanodonta woodiana]|uniref:Uncharacterized protein n=1 Tax=Sinanodonta woodiana TaxID=1069815 RepID=A0ABD3W3K9_SINWO
MGQSMSEQLNEETRPKKYNRKRKNLHQVLKILKKKDTRSNIENTWQNDVLCQYVLQELDNGQNLDKLVDALNMLLEKVLDRKKELDEIKENGFVLQRDKEDRLGKVASKKILEVNTNISSDTNEIDNDTQKDGIEVSIPKADSQLDSHYKELPSRLVVNSDNVQDGIEDSIAKVDTMEDSITKLDAMEDSITKLDAMGDSHNKEISSPLVINKAQNGKYAAGVIFVGDKNIFQINRTDLSRNMEKEADDKLMIIMRRKLFALKKSNARLELENRILRSRSIDPADHRKNHDFHWETGRRFCPSQRSNSFPSRTVNS